MAFAPTLPILLTLGILLIAIGFYVQSRIPIDLVSLGLLSALIVTFQIAPVVDPLTGANRLGADRLMIGFANPALITVVALLVVGEGIARTGALTVIARLIKQISAGNWRLALAVTLVVVAASSAFLNNTPVVVIFLPILTTLASEINVCPSKFLMPLSFVSILGGACTLIGTSTNILIAAYVEQTGIARFEMFTFSELGLIVLLVGWLYLVFVAPLFLPSRTSVSESVGSVNGRRQFTAQLQILSEATLVGKTIEALSKDLFAHVSISQIIRGERVYWPPFKNVVIQPEDLLIIMGPVDALKKLEWSSRATLLPENSPRSVTVEEQVLAEVVITPESLFVGRTLAQIRFRERFGAAVIAIQRHCRHVIGRITGTALRAGDLLLVQGSPGRIQRLSDRDGFLLFWGAQEQVVQSSKAPVAVAILVGIVLLAALDIADMLTLSVAGAFLMLAARCLTLRQAYRSISPQVVFLIAATLALGEAMQITGTAEFLANGMASLMLESPPWLILSLFGLLVMIFTNVISNNATAILFAPIAVQMAEVLNVSSLPFLVMVVFGANAAFSSPIGYKTNLLVLSAGCYRFRDFFRAGLPLNLIVWLLVSVLIPYYWPFYRES